MFSTVLCSSGLISAKTIIHTEGDSITVECSFSLSGRKKFLCKDKCEEGDVLIETEGDTAQRGRYSIQYEEGSFPVSSTVLYVSFTELKVRLWTILVWFGTASLTRLISGV